MNQLCNGTSFPGHYLLIAAFNNEAMESLSWSAVGLSSLFQIRLLARHGNLNWLLVPTFRLWLMGSAKCGQGSQLTKRSWQVRMLQGGLSAQVGVLLVTRSFHGRNFRDPFVNLWFSSKSKSLTCWTLRDHHPDIIHGLKCSLCVYVPSLNIRSIFLQQDDSSNRSMAEKIWSSWNVNQIGAWTPEPLPPRGLFGAGYDALVGERGVQLSGGPSNFCEDLTSNGNIMGIQGPRSLLRSVALKVENSMVNGRFNYSIHGVYKQTYSRGTILHSLDS